MDIPLVSRGDWDWDCDVDLSSLMIPRAPHETVGTTVTSEDLDAADGHDTVFVHPGCGQYFKLELDATKCRTRSSWNRDHVKEVSAASVEGGRASGKRMALMKASGVTSAQPSAMHRIECSLSSRIFEDV